MENQKPDTNQEESVEDILASSAAAPVAQPELPPETAATAAPSPVEEKIEEFEPNAVQDFEIITPRTSGAPDVIQLPSGSENMIVESLKKVPQIDITAGEKQGKWAAVLEESQLNLIPEDRLSDRMAEEGSTFRQHVEHGGTSYRGTVPSLQKKPGIYEVEGEQALLQIVSHLGIGGLFRAPMWNSGLWVTFKPASELELLELNRIVSSDKIDFGRWSYGLSLSNSLVYTTDRIFEFALNHVYATSVKNEELPIHKLRDYIRPQDIDSFIWGFLCANYPSGFHYERGCINDPVKCNHVERENINVTKLQWVDTSALNDWQRQHMSSRVSNSKSLESVVRYQEEMKRLTTSRLVLNKGSSHEIAFTIKTPTVADYVSQGHIWIGGLVEAVNAVLGLDASEKTRNAAINEKSKATALCQYLHWVEKIEYGDVSEDHSDPDQQSRSVITDRKSIAETLKFLSSTDSIREALMDFIGSYIAKSTVTVIGVPAYDCPNCGMPQDDASKTFPRHTTVIPLNVLQVFFGLLHQRIGRIKGR